MTLQNLLSYVLAALAAGGNALANVMQRKAGLEEPQDRPFGPRLLLDLVQSRTWLIGFGGLVASFVLQAVALGFGQLSAVEPIITLEVPLTLLAASRVFGSRLGRPEWNGILVMTAGMIVLVAILAPRAGDETNVSNFDYLAAGGGTAATIVVLIIAGQHKNVVWRTGCLGAAAGTSFGLTATMIKETISRGDKDGLLGVVTTWQTYVAIGFGVLGLVLVQWALHVGPLLAAQPGFTLMDPLVSILWGVLVFDETTRSGFWLIPATLGAMAVGYGVFLLAHSPVLAALAENGDESALHPNVEQQPAPAAG
ncbi:DMT family transporter [uncultured Jatrophihabitans sp.]|uniref:DMT family transporter n=1 Tax=uncultured Jatrophihabitans sp. TaxID=1610747 RepID=UPI0035CC9521